MRITFLLAIAAVAFAACDTISPTEPGNLVPRTVTENLSLPAIDLNGLRFHAQTFGSPNKPVIIFVHGGPGGDYRSMLPMSTLSDDYFLVFWDQRGTGLSQRVDKALITEETYLADLDALIDRYSPTRPVYLVGISWGSMYATMYINQHPGRVAGAVLIETGPLNGALAEETKKDMVDSSLGAEWLNDYAWSEQFLSPDDHIRMDYERAQGVRFSQPRFHESETNPEPIWRQGAVAARAILEDGQDDMGKFTYDFTTNLNAFKTPVLFIAGGLSEVLGESLQKRQIGFYPSASLKVIAGAGHDVGWVKSTEVVSEIRTYLNARKAGN